jgi:hypothetical protein
MFSVGLTVCHVHADSFYMFQDLAAKALKKRRYEIQFQSSMYQNKQSALLMPVLCGWCRHGYMATVKVNMSLCLTKHHAMMTSLLPNKARRH